MLSASFFRKPIDASSMLDQSYLSELRPHPSGCCDDDAGKTDRRQRRRRISFRRMVRKMKEKWEWWLRDRDLDRYDTFVEGVIQKRERTEDPIHKSPTMVRFGGATRFTSTGETIYDPSERAMVMGTLSRRRPGRR